MGSIKEFIAAFEQLAIHTDKLSDRLYVECFISGLKEAIHPMFTCNALSLAFRILNVLYMKKQCLMHKHLIPLFQLRVAPYPPHPQHRPSKSNA